MESASGIGTENELLQGGEELVKSNGDQEGQGKHAVGSVAG